MSRPLCFVLMPFGKKPALTGSMIIDFDAVYKEMIAPGIEEADLEPIRADEEKVGGVIQKPMFERLALCEYAVADLTTANANVFYELGIRHAIRPRSTVLMFHAESRLPFDVLDLRAIPYKLSETGLPMDVEPSRQALAQMLKAAREIEVDSPLFQHLTEMVPPDIKRLKTDVFRERVEYSADMKQQLAAAREEGLEALRVIEADLDPLEDAEGGVVIDLYLSYRDVSAWEDMVRLSKAMSRHLQETVIVQEQLGLALNRIGEGQEAERVLEDLLKRRGPSSETYGILGRVYKDRWSAEVKDGSKVKAHGYLKKAVDAYLSGFEADWRDAYPGINAVTLMEIGEPPDERREKILPVVTYSVQRRIAAGKPDYWDHATLLELAVLAQDENAAIAALSDALAAEPQGWMMETTANNLTLIREARARRGVELEWAGEIESELTPESGD
jgi:tetratricopeptide (TPR) repeat protein